ncbi:DNA (cytosine-5-)-methyltransferase [PVC group bacterium]|nr:DNA (cytosine-5-)-methyltransferase [PVC group bacterium]
MKVIELFAGVGGFRLGLEQCNTQRTRNFEIVWSNQWEPATKAQPASDIYVGRFGEKNHSNHDIVKVIKDEFNSIPNHDLLVGGFPCQDYSVARTLSQAEGLEGKKGVLWWAIHDIIKKKGSKSPKYLMLENVDRLLKSPATQRGRDFAVMLASLSDLGYIVEWRVVDASEFGMPQRRKRVYIMAYKKRSPISTKILKTKNKSAWIFENGTMQDAFPMELAQPLIDTFTLVGDLAEITNDHQSYNSKRRPFANVGIMINRIVYTGKGTPIYSGKKTTLSDVLIEEKDVPSEFFIEKEDKEKWMYLKGAKKELRTTSSGHVYNYAEGPITYPDALDRPSRTIVTGEGGKTPSRFKHVIKSNSGRRLRRLTPIELERLNMFPDNHTSGATDAKRAFFMGNALVVGVVE